MNAQGWTRGRRLGVAVTIMVVCLVVDHATKWLAVQYLMGRPPIIYLGDLFRLQYATNTGAFLSLGSQLPEGVREYVLTGLNSLILVVVGGLLLFRATLRPPVVIGLSLILSGGVGNLIDRIFRGGTVVDFMNMGIPWGPFQVRTGIFNVADIAIMAGLFLMIGVELLLPAADEAAAKPAREGEGEQQP
ncbi:MAG: signal peptidase II [Candidatus Hydrogenedens sp.]|nr:signal peptidase II [Candidatus Hydrogenedens sp.]